MSAELNYHGPMFNRNKKTKCELCGHEMIKEGKGIRCIPCGYWIRTRS